jgi:2-C-methyl-D-erythritol 4-phosphate cytidylyltransferase
VAVAVVVAAGRGERLGSEQPKALVALAGRPMLEWSVEALRAVAEIERVVAVLPPGELARAPAGTVAVAGGKVRSESVRCGLRAAGETDVVLVHDAARPLATAELFARALAALRDTGADAVVAGAPVADTLKEVAADGTAVVRTVDRARLWAAHTPQAFRREALERALASAPAELLAKATDEASLLERSGAAVHMFDAGEVNFKVTTKADLLLAELVLRARTGG